MVHGFVLRALTVTLAPAWIAAGCTSAQGISEERRPTAVRDSAGVEIVESFSEVWGGGDGWKIGEPLTSAGGGGEGDLYDVAGAVRLSDGRVAVADGGSREVRIYDSDGTLVSSFGGRGDGPGEFKLIQAMGALAGDTLWIYDFAMGRVSLLTPSDGVVRTVSLTPRLSAPAMVGRRSDGTWVVAEMWGNGDPLAPLSEGLAREMAACALYGADGTLLDTLGLFPGREVLHRVEQGRMTMGAVPFGHVTNYVLDGNALIVGDQVGHEFATYAPGGELARLVRWRGPSLELDPGAIASWVEHQVASASPDSRASVRAYLADVPAPERRPAYSRLLVDAEGFLWAAAYSHPDVSPATWSVFDRQGTWQGDVDVPTGFRPVSIGTDHVVGVSVDSFGVETVQVRPLERVS